LEQDPLLDLLHHLLERALARVDLVDEVLHLPDAGAQVLGLDEAALVELDDEPLHLVLELAHVARPLVGAQELHGLLAEAADTAPELVGVALHEVPREERDVLAPLAERRYAEREDLEPVEEVLTE